MRGLAATLALFLGISAGALAAAPNSARGPLAVNAAETVTFHIDEQDKDLRLRVTYPDGPGPYPVIVFSHGALSSKDLYNRIADHWASHGYVTILPTHLDSESLGYSFRSNVPREKIFFGRIGDMTFALEHLDDIARAAGIPGKIDTNRIAVAGHSFGVWIALIKAGLPVIMPDGSRKSFADPRVKAMVAYNGTGQMDQVPEERWGDVRVPVFAASGTNDPGATGDGVLRPWRWRMGAYDLTGGTDKYAVSITMGDHYYGGLICREGTPGPQDPSGLALVNGMSTTFLDAYLKGEASARKVMKSIDLSAVTDGRGFLERR